MLDLFRQLAAAIDAPERAKVLCRWCCDTGELGSGRDCNHCDYPKPPEYEPEEE